MRLGIQGTFRVALWALHPVNPLQLSSAWNLKPLTQSTLVARLTMASVNVPVVVTIFEAMPLPPMVIETCGGTDAIRIVAPTM